MKAPLTLRNTLLQWRQVGFRLYLLHRISVHALAVVTFSRTHDRHSPAALRRFGVEPVL